MQVKFIKQDRREEWNELAAQESSFALLQSWEWGEFKAKLGWKVFRVAVEERGQLIAGAQVLIKPLPAGMTSVAYVPRGPIGNWLENGTAALLFGHLHLLTRSHRAAFLKIEPPLLNDRSVTVRLKEYNFLSSPQTNQPCATLILDLSQDLETIYKNLRGKTRQYINSSSREGIVVRTGGLQDLPAFYHLMQKTGKRERFSVRSYDYYRYEWERLSEHQEYKLLMAFYQDQLIAARTIQRFGSHAAEFHAGSVDRFTHLHPNYLLAWKAIQWAKNAGCQTYDMWGIPDEISETGVQQGQYGKDANHGLWGVYQFKRGFTRNVVCYAGGYDYVYNQPIYRLITSRLFNHNVIEKIAVLLDPVKGFRNGGKSQGSFSVEENRELEHA